MSREEQEEFITLFYNFTRTPGEERNVKKFLREHPNLDINTINVGTYTPIQHACRYNLPHFVNLLLKWCEKLDVTNQRIYYYATTYIKDQQVLQRLLQKLQQQAPQEYQAAHEADIEQKLRIQKWIQTVKDKQNTIQMYCQAGAKKCSRCQSYFFEPTSKTEEQRQIELMFPLRLEWIPHTQYPLFSYGALFSVDMTTIKESTVCVGHTGKRYCMLGGGMSTPGCCVYDCCKQAVEHPGCTQYESHIAE